MFSFFQKKRWGAAGLRKKPGQTRGKSLNEGATAQKKAETASKPAAAGAQKRPGRVIAPPVIPVRPDGTPPIARAREYEARLEARLGDQAGLHDVEEDVVPPPPPVKRFRSDATASEAMQIDLSANGPVLMAQLELAQEYFKADEVDQGVVLLETGEEEGRSHPDLHYLLAEGYFRQKRWRESLERWNRTAILTPRDKSGRLEQIHRKIMRCNAQIALSELRKGNRIMASEHIALAIETADSIKQRADIVEPVVAIARDALEEQGVQPLRPLTSPRNIVICLDVIKISALHAHKHVYVSMAAALAARDPRATVTIVATYERQIGWNPSSIAACRPERLEILRAFINEKLPEDLRERIFVQHFSNFGLRGLIETCRSILDMKPDMILYGGGKSGSHSDESLLVRHILHKYVPSGLFLGRADDEVDDSVDVIIPRKEQALQGDPQEALVHPSPYPVFPGIQAAIVPEELAPLERKPHIVSAWADSRLSKVLNGYQNNEINRILDVLDRLPDMQWHVIGVGRSDKILPRHRRFNTFLKKKRIVLHPIQKYTAFYEKVRSASVFLHLPGFTGGGVGASIARNNDVPIICFENSDVAAMQPADYVFPEVPIEDGLEAMYEVLTNEDARDALIDLQDDLLEQRRREAPDLFFAAMQAGVNRFLERPADIELPDLSSPDSEQGHADSADFRSDSGVVSAPDDSTDNRHGVL